MSGELERINEAPVALSATSEMAVSRQAQEVQAAMVIAKKFPRDELASINRIKQSCRRVGLAEVACYEYPRGGQKVEGASIRLAEAMASAWGNLDYGVMELEQDHVKGESTVMAYCWDLQTNTRQSKIFQVSHTRHTRAGSKRLTDPRDIYEMVANQGARRVRACVLGIIPGDVQDVAVRECNKTLSGDNGKPMRERLAGMLKAFENYDVGKADVEELLRHPIDSCTERELVKLARIYNSIKDGIGKKTDFFDAATDVIKKPKAKKPVAKKPSGPPKTSAEEEAELIKELETLESDASDIARSKAREMAGVDDSEDASMINISKVKELIQLYKAGK